MENRKMNYIKSKNIVKMLAVLLMLSFVVSMAAVPKAEAVVTLPFVDVMPTVCGIGQPVLVNFGLLNFLANSQDGWNVTLVITDPDGKVERVDRMTWSTGTVGYGFTPTKEGNYTFQCTFKNTTYRIGSTTRPYDASESSNVTLQVLPGYWAPNHPGHSLPTDYWTRPVDSQLREWHTMMGSWLERPRSLYVEYQSAAPESAHILWSMPMDDGTGAGLAGGANDFGHESGDAYEGKWGGSVIVDGVLMYNKYYSTAAGLTARQTIVGVDLHTGKVLWENNFPGTTSRVGRGQTLSFWSVNNRAVFSYMWIASGTNWWGVEPRSGIIIFNMTGVPSGTLCYGPNGEILMYTWVNLGTTAAPNYILRQWNSTRAVMQDVNPLTGTGYAWGSRTVGQTRNVANGGFDRNITVSGLSTRNMGNPQAAFAMDRVVWYSANENLVSLTGVSLDQESGEGAVLFNNRTWTPPQSWRDLQILTNGATMVQSGWAAISGPEKVVVYWVKELCTNYAFSLETGKYLWETEPEPYANAWSDTASMSFGPERSIAYGKLITASCGGVVRCYDLQDGETLWEYRATQKYAPEYYLTNEWWLVITFVADGKVYLGHMEHSAQEPKPRGAPFIAIDVESGDVVWEIEGAFRQTRWGGRAIIGDSIIATMDTYDQQVYAIGKGPSEMTVSAPTVAVTAGTPALITGTVMDISPGTTQDNVKFRFPNGVPAVSEESQSDWMLCVYKQFSKPMDVKGVTVSLFAWDGQSADSVPIGTAETDVYGKYSIAWTPSEAGQYQIFAFFDGSASYYSSEAKADMVVAAAPVISEPDPVPPYGLYIALAAIAIIIAVVIVGLLLFMKISKR
jgi:hypothetical protein